MMNKDYYVLNETIWSCTDDDYNFTIVTEIDEENNIKKISVNACDEYGNSKELEDGEEPEFINVCEFWQDGIYGNEMTNRQTTDDVLSIREKNEILFNNYSEYFEYFNEDYEDTGDFDVINGKEYKIYRRITED